MPQEKEFLQRSTRDAIAGSSLPSTREEDHEGVEGVEREGGWMVS